MPKKKLLTKDVDMTEDEKTALPAADTPKKNNGERSRKTDEALGKLSNTRKEKVLEEKKMMQLNVVNHEDFLFRMAKYNELTVTKYLMKLIEEDEERNASVYELLKKLPKYDKPERVSPLKGTKYKRISDNDDSEDDDVDGLLGKK